VLVGGNGPGVLDRVLTFGDAWFPNHARGERAMEGFEAAVAEVYGEYVLPEVSL
jgi:hypothetical protein